MHNKIIYPVTGLILLLLSLSVIFTAISKAPNTSVTSNSAETSPTVSSKMNMSKDSNNSVMSAVSGMSAMSKDSSDSSATTNSSSGEVVGLKADDGDDDGQIVEIKVTSPDNIQNLNYTEPKG